VYLVKAAGFHDIAVKRYGTVQIVKQHFDKQINNFKFFKEQVLIVLYFCKKKITRKGLKCKSYILPCKKQKNSKMNLQKTVIHIRMTG